MFADRLASLINRHWAWLLIGWIVLAVGLKQVAPSWDEIAKDGDLEYLPAESPSLRGDRLLQEAFPNEKAKSQVVVVLTRGGGPLTPDDRRFGLYLGKAFRDRANELPLVDAWDERTPVVGDMMLAREGRAAMVVARLTNGLMDVGNIELLRQVQALVAGLEQPKPEGLRVDLTGSAVIGGDMRSSISESLASTELTTVLLVLGCLIMIYRAPALVLIPLATIGLSLSVATDVVALLAEHFGADAVSWSQFKVFTTTKIFVVVILFGAGTDYCLFLIARYKEELAAGTPRPEATGRALANVADALAGSALTTILGLATMAFAQYGKFVSSGPTVAICLFVALLACVTFAPALLRALGPLVFWPFGAKLSGAAAGSDAEAPPSDARLWGWVADTVMRRPATILAVTTWVSAPLVIYGATSVDVTHDFMADLDPDRVSVVGADTLRRHYDQGTIAPMKVVARLSDSVAATGGPDGGPLDLRSQDGRYAIAPLHSMLFDRDDVADVRSLYLPTGGDPRQQKFLGTAIRSMAVAGSPLSAETFVSHTAPHEGRVTQLAVVLADNPFSKTTRDRVPDLQAALARFAEQETLDGQPNPWRGARFETVGVTPGMRDLEVVTGADRTRIQVLTVAAVLLVLVAILRRPIACLYLILTVLVSYWATLGATDLFFNWLYGDTYLGLDWKVPVFLFVILIAVGQDYNIYLVTRVFEEQKTRGQREGLRRAIVQTGGIITSCGVIMAGTFVSMATGSLRGMVELGFALALGVMLDTFFIRTVVVPCYFALLAGREQAAGSRGSLTEGQSDLPNHAAAAAP